MSNKRTALIGIAAPLLFALLLLMAAPAAAHHKGAHEKGGGKGKAPAGPTEDNDSNDNDTPNNVVDGGDNRHPSGKDKSVEHGNSGNQGNSSSDPDDDGHGPDRSNGGPDKPDGSGGDDLADQDGNNGCGNDDDFEDDNEGWCGKNPKAGKNRAAVGGAKRNKGGKGSKNDDEATRSKGGRRSTCPDDETMAGGACKIISDAIEMEDDVSRVLGEKITRSDAGVPRAASVGDTTGTDSVVAGEAAERSASTMPFTGSGVAKLLIAAGALLLAGFLMLRLQHRA